MRHFHLYSTLCFAVASSSLLAEETTQISPPKQGMEKIYYYGEKYDDWYTSADLLVWQAYTQDAMNWVDLQSIAVNNPLTTEERRFNDIRSLKYGWETGFRVATGYRFGAGTTGALVRPWQIEASYTQLLSHATDSIPVQSGTSGTNFYVGPLVPVRGADVQRISGESLVGLSYRELTTQFSFPMWLSKNAIWRLGIGPSYAWFKNYWNSVYSSVPIDSTNIGTRGNQYSDFSWRFEGGGLLTTTDFHVELGKGIGFFGKGGIELLIGRISLQERYRNFTKTDSTATVHDDNNYERSFTQFQPAFSLGGGLDYKYWVIAKKMMLYFSAGYEWMYWPDLNQFGKVNERGDVTSSEPINILITTIGNFFDAEPSGLGFQGATVRFGLEF